MFVLFSEFLIGICYNTNKATYLEHENCNHGSWYFKYTKNLNFIELNFSLKRIVVLNFKYTPRLLNKIGMGYNVGDCHPNFHGFQSSHSVLFSHVLR